MATDAGFWREDQRDLIINRRIKLTKPSLTKGTELDSSEVIRPSLPDGRIPRRRETLRVERDGPGVPVADLAQARDDAAPSVLTVLIGSLEVKVKIWVADKVSRCRIPPAAALPVVVPGFPDVGGIPEAQHVVVEECRGGEEGVRVRGRDAVQQARQVCVHFVAVSMSLGI